MSGSTVSVQRPSGFNPYGEPLAPTTFPVADCVVYPSTTTETLNNRDLVVDDYTCLVPAGTDIRDTDRIVLPDGQLYEVTGIPRAYESPFTQWAPGIEVHLSRWEG